MSIKKLFDSNKPGAILTSTNLEEEIVQNAPELESADNVRQQIERIHRFVPQVDYSKPSSFARYGSAQSYYEDAISRITNQYPYDGSEEEITKFLNESNYLDLYIFDNKYPRTTGYIHFGTAQAAQSSASIVTGSGWGSFNTKEYIKIFGGPHTASYGMPSGSLAMEFTGANYYDTDIYSSDGTLALGRVGTRESNLKFDLSKGVSVEFWLNKESFETHAATLVENSKEVIFDLWNGEPTASALGAYNPNSEYGRFLLYLSGSGIADAGADPIRLHLASGSSVADISLLSSAYTTASIADNSWHHYAVTVISEANSIVTKAYVDGTLDNTITTALSFGEVTGTLNAHFGSLQTAPSGNDYATVISNFEAGGQARLSASADEFRYWKSKRDEKDIQYNWWTQVRGGTNNEIANAELGVYYKFNEGITGTSSVDSAILDYSGRISNGTWYAYPGSSARDTGSAMVSSSATVAGTVEYEDPIIYSFHPDVLTLHSDLSTSGSAYDYENQASIKDSIPSWIVDEDESTGTNDLKKLTQIIGSYFDSLYLQTENLSGLKDKTHLSASHKPAPFTNRLLSSYGLATPEIFIDATLLERFANRRKDREYSIDINEVKNLIYQNIYNNLVYIYKSKGTEKAFRNLIRCYGIGDEVVKFNAYGNNTEFKLEDTYYETTARKNYIDFNAEDRFGGTVFQGTSSANSESTTGPITYISGTSANFANTAEVEVIFPRKLEFSNTEYFHTPFLSASIFGFHVADTAPTVIDHPTMANNYNFQLYAVRTSFNSKDAYFLLSSSVGGFPFLTSSVYSNVYDNQKWNFAVRIKDKFWPYTNGITGSGVAGDGVLEWYGVNVDSSIIRNEFELSASSLHNKYLSRPRRYYVGADRTNFTGSVITKSDVKVSSLRHYTTYLNSDVIKAHALDPENIGTLHPTRNMFFTTDSPSATIDNVYIPEQTALALHWDFSEVTGSDADGVFTVEDASSGSVSLQTRYVNDGNISHIIANQYAGTGYFPGAKSSTKVVDKNFIPAYKQRLPEVVNSSDAVKVLSQDDEIYPRDAAISQTFFSFEKSMYGVISQEMINLFGTIVEFNNLIGEIAHKYRGEYKDLRLLRTLFFEKIQNNPDLDKFIDYYKWIDSSLSVFLQQLAPASANISDEIRVMVEDHILGRSKYQHQYPMLDYKGNERWSGDEGKLEARARGINELTYNWQFGHAPTNNLERTSALWWKERSQRSNLLYLTEATIDAARQSLSDIILSFNSASAEKFNTGAGSTGVYEGSTYARRSFARPLRVTPDISKQIGGGYNYPRNQKPDFYRGVIKRGSTTAGLQHAKGSYPDIDVAEVGPPILQIKRRFLESKATNFLEQNDYSTAKTQINSPLSIFSSSADLTDQLGYRSAQPDSSAQFAGIHFDTYGDDYEIPMQGPFTEAHVGGNRHRHVGLNTGPTPDTEATRPEAFNYKPASGILRANDAWLDKPSTSPWYHRDEIAKRPLNIKNIQHTTGSAKLGNFSKDYEVVQTSDRRLNNSEFVKNEGFNTGSSVASTFVTGLQDYTKPVRTRREHVIVERFSAPGSPETSGDNQGGAGLDVESAQYSSYNNLNYRNLTVRQPLQTLLTERSEQFGLRSGSSGDISADYITNYTASFHKINRNPLKRIEYDVEYTEISGGTIVTASTYDNYYVQHMIPRSDYQYAWITASYISSNTNVYGYFPYDGFVSTSAGLVSAINFASASDVVSFQPSNEDGGVSYPFGIDVNSHVFTDFAGMNTNIVDAVSGSERTLGYQTLGEANEISPLFSLTHRFWGEDKSIYGDNVFDPTNRMVRVNYINETFNSNAYIGGLRGIHINFVPYVLNSLILHRQGPYGHPTWKQVRVGQGQLGRHYRNNNTYTHTLDGAETLNVITNGGTTAIKERYGRTLMITQSVLTTKYLPLVHELQIRAGANKIGEANVSTVVAETSFGNNLVTFDDPEFSNLVAPPVNIADTAYKQLKEMYSRGALQDPSSPIVAVNRVIYKEIVYPSLKNMHTEKVRGRTNYYNGFWRDAREDRFASSYEVHRNNSGAGYPADGTFDKLTNSMGASVNQSIWPLDADESFATNLGHVASTGFLYATGGIDANNADGFRPGELQNKYTLFIPKDPPNGAVATGVAPGVVYTNFFQPGAIYARKHIMPYTSSVSPGWEMLNKINIAGSPIIDVWLHTASIGTGEAAWDAPSLAGRYEGTSSTWLSGPVNPFYDTYDDYFSEIKASGQSYSIIPEFRISDHIDFYRNLNENYLADNLAALQIVGTPSNSRIPQNSDEDNFFTTFTNSDFMKYFEVIREDHKELISPSSIKLRCRAIKKFMPYQGFYPVERTIQLASEFSSSVGPYIAYEGTDSDKAAVFNTFLKPFMAPGILYNTIKSGLAVDYPIMTGSYLTEAQLGYDGGTVGRHNHTASFCIMTNSRKHSQGGSTVFQDTTTGRSHNDGWDYRVPFEALVEPHKYLSGKSIVNDEPTIFAHMSVTASWSGQYATRKYQHMMHNFLAETVNFFIKEGECTKIVSKPQQEWKPMTQGQPYAMRVKIYRSLENAKQITGSWGDYAVPQNISGSDITNFTMYSRPSAFGPPVGIISGSDYRHPMPVSSAAEFSPTNGVYGSHTPPYYDGEAWFDIIYYPYTTNSPLNISASTEDRGLSTVIPTLEEIFTMAPNKTYYDPGSDAYFPMPLFGAAADLSGYASTGDRRHDARIGAGGTYIRKWRYDQEVLKANDADGHLHLTSSTYHLTSSELGPMAGPWANRWAMQADSSLNIFEKEGDSWKIQTKFETPMLNFNYLRSGDITQVNTNNASHPYWDEAINSTIPRGMWHQFGRIPSEEEGVYIQVTDVPDNWLENHPSSSVIWDPGGHFDKRNALTDAGEMADQGVQNMTGYRIPIDGAGPSLLGESSSGKKVVTNTPKSLIDICGFSTEPVKVGQVRSKKRIYEAVVAVPFVEDNGERKFFKLHSPQSMLFPGTGESIKRQVRLMEKYVFPPGMDFVQNPDKVDPIAMYIFEFSHDLDMDDLSHIWQNLPPKIGRKAEYGMATVSHPLLVNELLGDPEDSAEALREQRELHHIQFPEKLQWMVFKVKRRAKRNYFKQVGKSSDSREGIPFYTYNWPYDQFSLVELAQIQTDVEFGPTVPKPKPSISSLPEGLLVINPELAQQKTQASGVDLSHLTPVVAPAGRDTTDTSTAPAGVGLTTFNLGKK